eukprot:CAMPEP_0183486198 /NCGR_PEP_ID=MMETSP0370-20130417/179812_1 /TAXON_ID=268820 /ORGANISM="Peridinium aciculiferum, Strain PAER-2" /LENGTH=399 /DNA_ID=CAMNT_0025679509 /DNA_START=353 /DNA_END=1548 /DNA_ORIENTATION=+
MAVVVHVHELEQLLCLGELHAEEPELERKALRRKEFVELRVIEVAGLLVVPTAEFPLQLDHQRFLRLHELQGRPLLAPLHDGPYALHHDRQHHVQHAERDYEDRREEDDTGKRIVLDEWPRDSDPTVEGDHLPYGEHAPGDGSEVDIVLWPILSQQCGVRGHHDSATEAIHQDKAENPDPEECTHARQQAGDQQPKTLNDLQAYYHANHAQQPQQPEALQRFHDPEVNHIPLRSRPLLHGLYYGGAAQEDADIVEDVPRISEVLPALLMYSNHHLRRVDDGQDEVADPKWHSILKSVAPNQVALDTDQDRVGKDAQDHYEVEVPLVSHMCRLIRQSSDRVLQLGEEFILDLQARKLLDRPKDPRENGLGGQRAGRLRPPVDAGAEGAAFGGVSWVHHPS